MASADRPVRVRIAPSPTGDPHVGTAYIALFNYVFAKQQGGKFVLRIEDTDQSRFRADSEQQIYDALHWLGLSWDEGPDIGGPFAPYRQSERSAIYKQHAQILIDKGAAYRCFCTEDRLAKLKIQAKADKKNFGYDRHCRDLDPAETAKRTESHVVRLKMPIEGPIAFVDQLRGEIVRDGADMDDQVLMKSDGLPTYHLANVVDDHLMEITHVVRAEEWIPSTPKHVILYQAFGWEMPKFFHMSLLRNNDKDKSKVSKRKQPTSINYYKDIGILPEAMRNFLATMGWSFGEDREVFSLDDMIRVFSWDKISLGGPVFNLEKMTWMNEQYIHAMSVEQLAERTIAWRLNQEFLVKLLPLVHKRIKKLDEIVPMIEYFFAGDLDYAPVIAEIKIEGVAPADIGKALLAFVERFEARDGFTVAILTEEANAWAAAQSWTTKQAFPLLRFAVTARKASPPLFETMEVLGKEIARRRLRRCAEVIASGGKITR